MLKNIVFDLGGVVVNNNARDYLAERFLDKPLEDFLYAHIFDSPTWRELDAGRITLTKATELILSDCGSRRYEAQLVLDDWRDMLVTKKDTARLMEELKAGGYQLYYLSDIAADVLDIFKRKKRFMRLFSGGVASCEEKLLKPDPAIYHCLLERYNLVPAETVFIDDLRDNVLAAQALGMIAIPFRDAKDLRKTLLFLGFPLKSGVARKLRSSNARAKSGLKSKLTKKNIFSAVSAVVSPDVAKSAKSKTTPSQTKQAASDEIQPASMPLTEDPVSDPTDLN